MVHQIVDWFNVERVKAIAALIQAFGVVIAAILTYRFARKLESHKSDMKLKEIVHAENHKRERESLEKINRLMAKMVFKLGLVPPFFNDPEPVPDRQDDESFEQWHQRRFRIKIKAFNEAILELNHGEEEASIYLTSELQERLEKFRQQAVNVLNVYFTNREACRVTMGDPSKDLQKFKEDLQELRAESKLIVEEFKNQLKEGARL